jgi:hypothetical protein
MLTKKSILEQRRQLLSLLVAGSAGLMSGCSLFARRGMQPICPTSPEVSFPGGPLIIDAHCHVFNGTDLQVKEFFSKVAVRQGGALGFGAQVLGSILQSLAWSSAPTGEAELRELRSLADALKFCTDKEHMVRVAALRQSAYTNARQQLQSAAARSLEYQPLYNKMNLSSTELDLLDAKTAAKIDALRLIEGLPAEIDAYRAMREKQSLSPMVLKGPSVQGLIDFVIQNFQYRYVSVHDYLKTYNEKGTRVVDLMLPSMVDYDYWLAGGNGTPTTLSTQVEVMRQIAVMTGGRVHSFVPFDPLRQVAFELNRSPTDSHSLVVAAVQSQGCIGVKLYPPMGFAAMGNKDLKKKDGSPFWARDWLPKWAGNADLGQKLDDAMLRMLKWCETNEVPVMAHTNISNGVTDDFEELAGSKYWAAALDVTPNLRVSFGHFGDTSPVEDGLSRARGFTALMSTASGVPGSRAFADAGYFVEVLKKQPELLTNLRLLYEDAVPPGRAPLAARFMYGTDWEMTLTEGSIDAYLADFVNLFDELEGRQAIRQQRMTNLSGRFFGGNAADWAGLRKGEKTRQRLDSFYAKHGVPTPDWANKLG